ncbi:MAG: ETC complex I subunit [Alphaproteobacteria bacterium]
MTARIYRPAKTAMQSGRAKTKQWVLEFEPTLPKSNDPLMGWTSSGDTKQQLRLQFPTREEAVAYAEARGITYVVNEPHANPLKAKSYAANFAWNKTA